LRFGIEIWLILFGIMKFKSQLERWILRIYFPNYEKFKYFVETLTAYNQKLIFEEKVCIPMWIFIFATDHAQINSVIVWGGWKWPQSTHRVAIADFWCTFNHNWKISPVLWGWGCTPTPLSLCLPSRTKSQWSLQLRGQIHSLFHLYPCMYSVEVTQLANVVFLPLLIKLTAFLVSK
jgi:hypothetical protein